LPLSVIALGTDAPHRLNTLGSCGSPVSRQQGECKRCAELFRFQGTKPARFPAETGGEIYPLTYNLTSSQFVKSIFEKIPKVFSAFFLQSQ